MNISHTFHVVDQIPHGAIVARRDEEGDVHTYISREGSLEQIAMALSWICNTQGQSGDYDYIPERHAEVG